jgi:hypothetical protein
MGEQDGSEKCVFIRLVWAKVKCAKERRKGGAPFIDNKRFHLQCT